VWKLQSDGVGYCSGKGKAEAISTQSLPTKLFSGHKLTYVSSVKFISY
jgi:hypothetical protein